MTEGKIYSIVSPIFTVARSNCIIPDHWYLWERNQLNSSASVTMRFIYKIVQRGGNETLLTGVVNNSAEQKVGINRQD